MKFLKTILCCICLLTAAAAPAQRLQDVNAVGWYSVSGTVYITTKTSLWLEYQWRRENIITNWQQSLPRIGIQRHLKDGVSILAGYAYPVAFPYGDYPAGPHPVPEHRIFEQLMWNGTTGRVVFNHRLRLEQRFIGKVNQSAADMEIDGWRYVNRVRYQLRAAIPLNHKTMKDKTWYLLPYDEIFIGFGKNVGQNIFDQNRAGLLLGYQLNKSFRFEGGYFNQTVLQGSLVTGKQVVQYNHGVLLGAFVTKYKSKKPAKRVIVPANP